MGVEATNVGYNGGYPCPPQTCSSPQNSTIPGPYTQGFDGMERLTSMRNAEWLQSNQFELLIKGFEQKGWQVKYKAFGEEYKRQFSMEQTSYMKGILEGGEEIRRIYDLWAITIDFTIWQQGQSGQDDRLKKLLERIGKVGQGKITTVSGKVSNNVTPRILDDKDCQFLLNELFGNYGTSVMAAYYHPPKLLTGGGTLIGGRVNDEMIQEFATHIYGGIDGSKSDAPFYIPANSDGSAPKTLNSFSGESAARNGNISTYITGIRDEKNTTFKSASNVFEYKNGLVIVANHIKAPNLNYQKGATNRQGSFQVGFMGGLGGTSPSGLFNHVHLSFFREINKKWMRVDPRYEFCSGKYQLK
jgi:hypothetical protein